MSVDPVHQVALLETVDGTREQAEARMRQQMSEYRPRHPAYPQRTRVYRIADGWLMLLVGASGKSYSYQFQVCELEWDSSRPDHAPPQQHLPAPPLPPPPWPQDAVPPPPKDAVPFHGMNTPHNQPPAGH